MASVCANHGQSPESARLAALAPGGEWDLGVAAAIGFALPGVLCSSARCFLRVSHPKPQANG